MSRLDDLLEEHGTDALLVVARSSRDPNIAPFVGGVRLGGCLLVCRRGGAPRLGYLTPMERGEAAASGLPLLSPEQLDIARWGRGGSPPHEVLADILAKAFQHAGLAPCRVALAGNGPAGRVVAACALLAEQGWSFEPGEAIVLRWRKRKDGAALDEVRLAAAGVESAFRRIAGLLSAAEPDAGELWLGGERLRVRRLRHEAARVFAEHGLSEPEGNLIAPGEEGATPHNTGSQDRVLRPSESLVVDLFPRSRLFADCTRTFCVGEPPEYLARGHEAVCGALGLAAEQAGEGVDAWSLQEAVCNHLAAAGYRTPVTHPGTDVGYVHGLGHGVGFELHEEPVFQESAGAGGMLEPGDVLTLEPGLYDPGEGWAVRVENLYGLGENGLENLTPLPVSLDPRAWQG